MDRDFGHWLAGFVDGEGHFQIRRRPKRSENAMAWQVVFRLNLHWNDRDVLHLIAERTGLGKVGTSHSPGRTQLAYWQVCANAEVRALATIFDAFPLRARKRVDFEIWRAALDACERRDWPEAERRYQELAARRAAARAARTEALA